MEKTASKKVHRRIDEGGERFWRLVDFQDLPLPAVVKTLSRLAKAGHIQRLSKGVYYRAQTTPTGQSQPDLSRLKDLAAAQSPIFPAGRSAAHLLGFTHSAPRSEVSTIALSLPRKLIGQETLVHTMRPPAWSQLSPKDAALLEFLREKGRSSELSPHQTVARLLAYFSEPARFEALMQVAATEPPRVRALLGAIGQQLAEPEEHLRSLRASLNPLSRFDFGALHPLRYAKDWQARPAG
jgi:hypothetical protein